MTVYLDLCFFINFFANLLMLLLAAQGGGWRYEKKRLVAGAALGGCYGCGALAYPWLQQIPFRMGFLFFMAVVVFPRGSLRKIWKKGAICCFCAAALSGMVLMLSSLLSIHCWTGQSHPLLLILELGCSYFLLSGLLDLLIAKQVLRPFHCQIKLCWGGRECLLKGWIDSGNWLTHPFSGQPVSVAEWRAIEKLFSPEIRQSLQRMWAGEIISPGPPFETIPFHTVGGGMQQMPVFQPERCYIKKGGDWVMMQDMTIGVTEQVISNEGLYEILLHAKLLKEEGEENNETVSHRA